jgi:outer membrane protein assembly factor BamB
MTIRSNHLPLPIRNTSHRLVWRQSARNLFIVAGAFVLIVAGIMLASVLRDTRDDLKTAPRLEQLKKELAADPGNEPLKISIRTEDQAVRQRWFARRAFLVHGAWLLLAGAIVLAGTATVVANLDATAYLPHGPAPVDRGPVPAMKISLGIGTAITVAMLIATRLPAWNGMAFSASMAHESATAASAAPATPVGPPAKILPTFPPLPVQLPGKNWLNFRGSGNVGTAVGKYPLQWDASTGKNIAWHVKVPLPGNGSPIVCGDCVIVSGGTDQKREVYGFDVKTGSLKWTRAIGQDGPRSVEVGKDTGWAPSTPASDGLHIFVVFPTGDVSCLDLSGQLLWTKTFDVTKNIYGHASSPVAYNGMLFVQFDRGGRKDNLSALFALDGATGNLVWKASRPVASSWSTPSIIQTASGRQLITLATPWVIAYEPKTGAELWRASGLQGEVATSSTFADGVLYAATDQSSLLAIRTDGRGDVTRSHLKRLDPDTLPDIVSPVAIGSRVLLESTSGTLCWFDPASQKNVWSQDIEAGFQSSPIVVGNDRIYIVDRQGATHLIEIGDTFHSLAVSPIGQEVIATPAFSDGRIFIRGRDELFCVAEEASR